ncbi:hypothetical protein BH23ACI1_BH23ACI1_22910 [soil metagenome]
MPRALALLLTAAAITWTVVLFAAPAAIERGGPGAAMGAVPIYASASRICHQQPERSFTFDGVQLPVCARCSGLYISGAVGALLAWVPRRRREGVHDRRLLVICALPTALTWGLEFGGVASFTNAARALAAVPLGAAAGWVFVRALADEARAAEGRRITCPEPPAIS